MFAEEAERTNETDLSKVQTSAARCRVCAVLLSALQRWDAGGNDKILLRRTHSAIFKEGTNRRVLRFSVDPGE